MTLLLVVGTTETADIDGISAAGADPEAMRYTPAADAELIAYGDVASTPAVPVSPNGCPTPALVTRAVRELVGFDCHTVDAGLAVGTAAPSVTLGAEPGADIREPEAVPGAETLWTAAEQYGRDLPLEEITLAESIPGGTTTAMAVTAALGVHLSVSSSLPENPLQRKATVVETALSASGTEPGGLAGQPTAALRAVGDPVLTALSGVAAGALATGTTVTLAGGTQQLAVAALLRHAGVESAIEVATTPFVAADDTANVHAVAETLAVDLTVTDPGFDADDHVAFRRYCAGEAKEGAGMGGALALADRAGVPMGRLRDRIRDRYEDLEL